MANRTNDRYIRYYTPGAAAPKIERRTDPKHLPKAPAAPKRIPIPFNPATVLGTAVAVLLLVCIVVGMFMLHDINTQVQKVETQVNELKEERAELLTEFRAGYDPEEIRVAAAALGMIPAEEAVHITASVEVPAQEQPLNWLEQLIQDFQDLFA